MSCRKTQLGDGDTRREPPLTERQESPPDKMLEVKLKESEKADWAISVGGAFLRRGASANALDAWLSGRTSSRMCDWRTVGEERKM